MNQQHPYGRHSGPMVPAVPHDRLEIPPSLLWCAGCNGFQSRKGARYKPFFKCAACRTKGEK